MIDERGAERRWRIAVLAVGGLLVAIAVIGVVGIVINRNIHQTVQAAITFDLALEDRGDDLRVAILELRHYHRDLLLNNPDGTRIDLWRGRYEAAIDEIDALQRLLADRPEGAELPDVGELRRIAEGYYRDFTTAVRTEVTDRSSFEEVATDMLVPIDEMERRAVAFNRATEERAAASYVAIDDASTTGTLVLLGVIVGVGAMGAVFAVAVLRLVQDQRRLVVAEQAAAAQMAATSRAKTDFIADASHELRTPLTVLRGNAEIGLAMQDDCDHAEILSEIVAQSARMSRLVDDLLFLARSDASSVPLELRDLDADELLTALSSRAEMLARERGATLRTEITAARAPLRVDPDRLEQAVLVLVDNAAKYGPSGGTIDLAVRAEDGMLELDVADRGPGIPAAEAHRVFERFYRLDPGGGSRAGGTGLGLSIAAAIAEGHGGAIEALPREGGGTIMRVRLPTSSTPAGSTT